MDQTSNLRDFCSAENMKCKVLHPKQTPHGVFYGDNENKFISMEPRDGSMVKDHPDRHSRHLFINSDLYVNRIALFGNTIYILYPTFRTFCGSHYRTFTRNHRLSDEVVSHLFSQPHKYLQLTEHSFSPDQMRIIDLCTICGVYPENIIDHFRVKHTSDDLFVAEKNQTIDLLYVEDWQPYRIREEDMLKFCPHHSAQS